MLGNDLLPSLCRPAKDDVATSQTGKEGVIWAFFARSDGVDQPQDQHGGLVNDGESGQIAGMLFCGPEDQPNLFFQGAGAKQHDHDEGMRKADFGTVNGAIAGGFEDGEERGEVRVEKDGFDLILGIGFSSEAGADKSREGQRLRAGWAVPLTRPS